MSLSTVRLNEISILFQMAELCWLLSSSKVHGWNT